MLQVSNQRGKDGSARIMDFGIARTIESKGITGDGVMIGPGRKSVDPES
jgi:hypothetical protein